MSQDIVADALNQIMNARRVEKNEVIVKKSSKLLTNLLEIMKSRGHIDYEVLDDKSLKIKIIKLSECRAVKPRYFVNSENLEKYLRRFLPSRRFGSLIVSTNKGLMDQHEAIKTNTGGALIAYFY